MRSFNRVWLGWRSHRRWWLFIAAIFLLVLAVRTRGLAAATSLLGTVDYAKSGHTLELLDELTPEIPVMAIRLEGVEAPALEQKPWGEAARDCLSDLRNQTIQIETDDLQPDAYGRLWGYVWEGKTLVNQVVLEQGCAYLSGDRLAYGQHYQTLLYAQELARLLGRGLWDPTRPLRETPETFRRRSHSP